METKSRSSSVVVLYNNGRYSHQIQLGVVRPQIGRLRTVYIVPPVAHAHRLIENGPVRAQETEADARVQTPVPHLAARLRIRIVAGQPVHTAELQSGWDGRVDRVVHIGRVSDDLLLDDSSG